VKDSAIKASPVLNQFAEKGLKAKKLKTAEKISKISWKTGGGFARTRTRIIRKASFQ
jgi:hypothetical protein